MKTLEEHKEIFTEILGHVRKIFLQDGHVYPVAFVIKPDHREVYLIASMANEDEKDKLSKFLTQQVDAGAEAILMVSESWMVSGPNKEELQRYGSVSDHPRREEIIMANYSCREREMMAIAQIHREEVNPWSLSFEGETEKPGLGEWNMDFNDKGELEGRFCNFWAKARRQHSMN